MGMYDLTTLASCKLWLGSTNTNSDAIISQQITEISGVIMGWLNGPSFLKKTRTEYYDGKGRVSLTLKNGPVLSVASLTINGVVVPASPSWPTQAGWFLEPWDGDCPANLQSVVLNGYCYWRGFANVQITYTTGYVATDSNVNMSATFQYVPQSPQGLMVADAGVTYAATGIALTAVASNPAQGQYVAPTPLAGAAAVNYYLFNAADVAAALNVSYAFVPSAIQSVVNQLVGERIAYKDRIGLRSKSLGGQETMSYEINKLPDWARISLQPFQNVIPIS